MAVDQLLLTERDDLSEELSKLDLREVEGALDQVKLLKLPVALSRYEISSRTLNTDTKDKAIFSPDKFPERENLSLGFLIGQLEGYILAMDILSLNASQESKDKLEKLYNDLQIALMDLTLSLDHVASKGELSPKLLDELIEELKLISLALTKRLSSLISFKDDIATFLKVSAKIILDKYLGTYDLKAPKPIKRLSNIWDKAMDMVNEIEANLNSLDTPEEKIGLLLALSDIEPTSAVADKVENLLRAILQKTSDDSLMGKLIRKMPRLAILTEKLGSVLESKERYEKALEELGKEGGELTKDLSSLRSDLLDYIKDIDMGDIGKLIDTWNAVPPEIRAKITDAFVNKLTELLLPEPLKPIKELAVKESGKLLKFLQEELPDIYDQYMERLAEDVLREGDRDTLMKLISDMRSVTSDYSSRQLFRKLIDKLETMELDEEMRREIATVGFYLMGLRFFTNGYAEKLKLPKEDLLWGSAVASPKYYRELSTQLGTLHNEELVRAFLQGGHLRELLALLGDISSEVRSNLYEKLLEKIMDSDDDLLVMKVCDKLLREFSDELSVELSFYISRELSERSTSKAIIALKKITSPQPKIGAILGVLSVIDEEMLT